MIGRNINIFVPESISKIHDQILLNFVQSGKERLFNKERTVFYRNKNNFINPGQIFLSSLLTYKFGLKYIQFLTNRDYEIRVDFPYH